MSVGSSSPGTTYGERAQDPAHRSVFRMRLRARAEPGLGPDPVHEYLIDQANARGFYGAFSSRSTPAVDAALSIEDIVVGLLQPHAPVEPRVLKLVTRIIQSGAVDPHKLVFRAKRERALPILRWLVEIVPAPERNEHVTAVDRELAATPGRSERRPKIEYDPRRLLSRRTR